MKNLAKGLVALGVFLAAACNTIGGFGEDVEHVGDRISDHAEDVQN